MSKEYGAERAFGVPQSFLKREASRIGLLVAKEMEECFVSGKTEDAKHFLRDLRKQITLGTVSIDSVYVTVARLG